MTDKASPDVRSPKRAEAWAKRALARANAAGFATGKLFRQDFSPVALVAAASPATVLDNPYTSGTTARSASVTCAISGTIDVVAPITAQLVRDGSPFGAVVTWTPNAGGFFGGSITQFAPSGSGPSTHTYGLLLTSAGRTFSVPMGSAGFAISDL